MEDQAVELKKLFPDIPDNILKEHVVPAFKKARQFSIDLASNVFYDQAQVLNEEEKKILEGHRKALEDQREKLKALQVEENELRQLRSKAQASLTALETNLLRVQREQLASDKVQQLREDHTKSLEATKRYTDAAKKEEDAEQAHNAQSKQLETFRENHARCIEALELQQSLVTLVDEKLEEVGRKREKVQRIIVTVFQVLMGILCIIPVVAPFASMLTDERRWTGIAQVIAAKFHQKAVEELQEEKTGLANELSKLEDDNKTSETHMKSIERAVIEARLQRHAAKREARQAFVAAQTLLKQVKKLEQHEKLVEEEEDLRQKRDACQIELKDVEEDLSFLKDTRRGIEMDSMSHKIAQLQEKKQELRERLENRQKRAVQKVQIENAQSVVLVRK